MQPGRPSSLLPLWVCLLTSVLAHAALLAPRALAEGAGPGGLAALPLHLVSAREPTAETVMSSSATLAEARAAGGQSGSPESASAPGARTYWPPEALEQLAVVVSAPDIHLLEGLRVPAEQIRLRLFIDERGRVHEVRLLDGRKGDWAGVQRMFAATAFIPARREGREVASTLDIEIDIRDLVRVL